MKKVIVFGIAVLVILSFNEPVKKRYFFVGFDSESTKGSRVIETDGSFFTYGEIIKDIKGDLPQTEDEEKITITGIYEFKSKAEMEYFYSDYNKRKFSDD